MRQDELSFEIRLERRAMRDKPDELQMFAQVCPDG